METMRKLVQAMGKTTITTMKRSTLTRTIPCHSEKLRRSSTSRSRARSTFATSISMIHGRGPSRRDSGELETKDSGLGIVRESQVQGWLQVANMHFETPKCV